MERIIQVKGNHPLAEILAKKLFSIENVPKTEMKRMINRAIRVVVEYYEEHKEKIMNIIYSDMKLPSQFNESVFLAGPTKRITKTKCDDKTQSWRKKAIELFKENEYKGTIYIPERRDWLVKFDYTDQVEWELNALDKVSAIMFWIPRELKKMPAFTTNTEYGLYIKDDTVEFIYGRPDKAPKNRYLDFLYRKIRDKEPYNNLEQMIKEYCSAK